MKQNMDSQVHSSEVKEDEQIMFEAYNIVLHEWTKALCTLGASEHLPAVVLQLWVMYLRRLGVAFLSENTYVTENNKSESEENPEIRTHSLLQGFEERKSSETFLGRSKRGKVKLHHEGFSYTLFTRKGYEYWWCEKKTCSGRLKLVNWRVVSSIEHSHPRKCEEEFRLLKQQACDDDIDVTKYTSFTSPGRKKTSPVSTATTKYCDRNVLSLYDDLKKTGVTEIKKSRKLVSSSTCNSKPNSSTSAEKKSKVSNAFPTLALRMDTLGLKTDNLKKWAIISNRQDEKYGKMSVIHHSEVAELLSSKISKTQLLESSKIDTDSTSESSRRSSRLGGKKNVKYKKFSSDESDDHFSCSSGSDEEYTPYGKKRTSKFNGSSRKRPRRKFIRDINRETLYSRDSVNTVYEESVTDEEPLWSTLEGRGQAMIKRGEENNVAKVKGTSKQGRSWYHRYTEVQCQRPEETDDEERDLLSKRDIMDKNESWEGNNDSKLKIRGRVTREEKMSEEIENRVKFQKQRIKRVALENQKKKMSHTFLRKRSGERMCKLSNPARLRCLPYMLNILLSVLYLAVLLAQEQILLMDILRWCQEGHIPYLSSPYLVKSRVKDHIANKYLMRKVPRIPSSGTVRKIACQMSIFLSLQVVPLPPVEDVIIRMVRLLRLPEQVVTVAQELVSLRGNKICKRVKLSLELPSVESLAMAAVVLSLKICCSINDLVEHHLSTLATRINMELGSSCSFAPLFSWDDWKRYITRLHWFCKQVNPLSGLMCSASEMSVDSKSAAFLPKLSQVIFLCKSAPPTHMKDMEKYTFISSLVDLQGQSLQEVFDKACIGRATNDPLLGILEQSTTKQSEEETQQSPELLKIGQDLLHVSFASHQLYWTQEITHIQQNLKNCGSQIILKPVFYPKKQHAKCVTPPHRIRDNGNSSPEESQSVLPIEVDYLDSSDHASHFSNSEHSSSESSSWEHSFNNISVSSRFDDDDIKSAVFHSACDSSSGSVVSEKDGHKRNIFYRSTDSAEIKASSFVSTNKNFASGDISNHSSVSEGDLQTNIYWNCCSVETSSDSSDSEDGHKRNIFYRSSDSADFKTSSFVSTNESFVSEDISNHSSDSEGDTQSNNIYWNCNSVETSSDSSDSETLEVDRILRNECRSSGNILFVPMPMYRVWRTKSLKKNWKDFWNTLPTNYKWLITLGSLLCMVSKEELVNDVDLIEKNLSVSTLYESYK